MAKSVAKGGSSGNDNAKSSENCAMLHKVIKLRYWTGTNYHDLLLQWSGSNRPVGHVDTFQADGVNKARLSPINEVFSNIDHALTIRI